MRFLTSLASRFEIGGELLHFFWQNKWWWLTPVVAVLLLVVVLILFAEASAIGPFIYTLF